MSDWTILALAVCALALVIVPGLGTSLAELLPSPVCQTIWQTFTPTC